MNLLQRVLHLIDPGGQTDPPNPIHVNIHGHWVPTPGPAPEERAMAARLLDEDIVTYGEVRP